MKCTERVFLDANVFVATWTLDVLLTLADRGAFEPVWSEAVLREAQEAVGRVHRMRDSGRYIAAAARAFPYAMADSGEDGLAVVELPDPDDRHVVAAALAGGCGTIVTYNVKDFPAEALSPLGLRAVRPDDFLMEIAAGDPEMTAVVVRAIVAAKRYPPRTVEEEVKGLRANMLGRFAGFIERALGLD